MGGNEKNFEISLGSLVKEYDVATNGISLHVTEQGEGPAVLFCHGFPDSFGMIFGVIKEIGDIRADHERTRLLQEIHTKAIELSQRTENPAQAAELKTLAD